VSALAALGPAGAEGEDGAALFGNQRPQMMQQATAREDTSVLAPMSAELRRQIAESANAAAGELSPKLQAYIESELIAPAFTRANEEWRQSGLTIAQPEVGEITEGIAWLQSHVPTAAIDLKISGVDTGASTKPSVSPLLHRRGPPGGERQAARKRASFR
jgi:hypothetical protein